MMGDKKARKRVKDLYTITLNSRRSGEWMINKPGKDNTIA